MSRTTGSPVSRKSRLIWIGIFAAFLGAVVFWPDPKSGNGTGNSAVIANIDCAATAVVLHQHMFSVDPDATSDASRRTEAFVKTTQGYLRGLRRRDDPHLPQVRPIIARAEAARDEAVASDADAFVSDALSKLEACTPKLSGVSST